MQDEVRTHSVGNYKIDCGFLSGFLNQLCVDFPLKKMTDWTIEYVGMEPVTNMFGLNGTSSGSVLQSFNVRFCCRNGTEYLGHQVDFRSPKLGQRMIPMLVCPALLVTQIQMASSTVYDMILWYDMIYNTLSTPTNIISGPWVSVTRECYFMVVDLDLLTCDVVNRVVDASATCSWASSLWDVTDGPHRAQVSPFRAEFLSELVESQFPQSDEMAKSCTDLRRMELECGKKCADARAEPCQKKHKQISQAARTRRLISPDF